jgi:hypothetical protein
MTTEEKLEEKLDIISDACVHADKLFECLAVGHDKSTSKNK